MFTEYLLGFVRSFLAVAAATGFLSFAPQASAQESTPTAQATPTTDGDDWAPIDSDNIQAPSADKEMPVIAPQLKSTRAMRPGGTPAPIKMTTEVRYDDLDLHTPHGAEAFRARVHSAAQDVCEQLAAAYPVYEMRLTSCKKAAERNARIRADRIISGKVEIQKP